MIKNVLKSSSFFMCVTILLVSCSSINTIGAMLPKIFENNNFNGEMRLDSYSIIGNGFHDQTTSIMNKNTDSFYQYLKNLTINNKAEDNHARYGGAMTVYSFDNHEIKFWDGYLFLEDGKTPYKGDFYQTIDSSASNPFVADVSFHSFKIDAGELSIKNDNSLSSDNIRSSLKEMRFMPLEEHKQFDNPLSVIKYNNQDSLYIYNEKEFKITNNEQAYCLYDNYSFSAFLRWF